MLGVCHALCDWLSVQCMCVRTWCVGLDCVGGTCNHLGIDIGCVTCSVMGGHGTAP